MAKSDNEATGRGAASASSQPAQTTTLEHAGRFLKDENVRQASREKKSEFLRAKGLAEADIKSLLDEEAEEHGIAVEGSAAAPAGAKSSESGSQPHPSEGHTASTHEDNSDTSRDNSGTGNSVDKVGPIITYPEFLARPARPPPLITPTGFLHTLYGFAGLSTLAYGAAQLVVAPMVASTADARIDLHETALKGLSGLIARLESAVSEIPPAARGGNNSNSTHAGRPGRAKNDQDDDAATASSSCDDPTELFHRDIGVQTSTSLPPSPGSRDRTFPPSSSSQPPLWSSSSAPPPTTAAGSPAEQQAARLADLSRSLRAVRLGIVSQSEDYGDIRTVLDAFKDDLAGLTYPAPVGAGSSFSSLYGGLGRNEPDDEVRRVKENIRSVKGILLSARSFPPATSR